MTEIPFEDVMSDAEHALLLQQTLDTLESDDLTLELGVKIVLTVAKRYKDAAIKMGFKEAEATSFAIIAFEHMLYGR